MAKRQLPQRKQKNSQLQGFVQPAGFRQMQGSSTDRSYNTNREQQQQQQQQQQRDSGNFTTQAVGKRRSSSVHKLSTIRTATDNTGNNIEHDKEESKFIEEEKSKRDQRQEFVSWPQTLSPIGSNSHNSATVKRNERNNGTMGQESLPSNQFKFNQSIGSSNRSLRNPVEKNKIQSAGNLS